MPTFRINGLNRESGHAHNATFTATTEGGALERAASAGIVVENCVEVESPGEPSAAVQVPEYDIILLLGRIYVVVGVIGFLVGVGIGFLAFNQSGVRWFMLLTGAGWCICSLVLLGFAQAVLAFRDIARNSWRSANAAESMKQ